MHIYIYVYIKYMYILFRIGHCKWICKNSEYKDFDSTSINNKKGVLLLIL